MDKKHAICSSVMVLIIGRVGAVVGRLQGPPAWLPTHYVPWQRNRCRRAMNRLASAQVTDRDNHCLEQVRLRRS